MSGKLVRQRRLFEDVAEHLERMILAGEMVDDGRLPSERDLMRHFGVGRPSVREALLHLSRMGLVEVRSGERARVTRPTPRVVIDQLAGPARHLMALPGGLQDFQGARLFFEVGLARHAAVNATDEDLDRLRDALAANRDSLGDLTLFERTDVAFHFMLAVIMRNRIFTAMHAALAGWLLEQRRTTLADGEDRVAYEAHAAIFDAIAARDPDRSERAMREHLGYVANRYSSVTEGRAGVHTDA